MVGDTICRSVPTGNLGAWLFAYRSSSAHGNRVLTPMARVVMTNLIAPPVGGRGHMFRREVRREERRDVVEVAAAGGPLHEPRKEHAASWSAWPSSRDKASWPT